MVEANNTAPEAAPPQATGIAGTVVSLADRAARWTPQQVVNIVALVLIGALVWLTHSTISMLLEMQATHLRNSAEREELMRQHCDRREDQGRAFYAAEREKDRQFYAAHLKGKGGGEE